MSTTDPGTNPWLPAPSTEPASSTPTLAHDPRPTGPTRPQLGITPPDPGQRLPDANTTDELRPTLWWLGTHGGAGESCLAALQPGSRAADHAWPHPDGGPTHVILTARSSAYGLNAARFAAVDWASGRVPHVQLLGLVVIADAPGRLPGPLREFLQLVAGAVPRLWQLPWIEAWRLGETPREQTAPKPVRDLLHDIRTELPLQLLSPAASRGTT